MVPFQRWMRGIAACAILLAASFVPAQSQCVPNQQAFDTAYWASKAPAVVALQAVSNDSSQAAALASQGYVIDVPIQVFHWDACLVMSQRVAQGYTWVPSALQPNIIVAPGLTYNGQAYDPNNPPAGSIRVSVNAADYKPFNPPAPVVTVAPSADPVGSLSFGTMYLTVPGDTRGNGATFTDSRGTFTKTVIATPFGNEAYWTLTSGGSN